MPTLDASQLLQGPSDLDRPWVHHLNGDTSWLIQIPRTDGSSRAFFNLLLDPWFDGVEVAMHRFLHEQEHLVPSAVKVIAELEEFLIQTEAIAQRLRGGFATPDNDSAPASLLDAVVVTLDASDHCHKETLLEIHPSVPAYGLKRSAKLMSCFHHFDKVHTIPFYSSGSRWQDASISVGSSGITLSGLQTPNDYSTLFYGCVVAFPNGQSNLVDLDQGNGELSTPSTEAIVYLPHGIRPAYLAHLATAKPAIRYVALIQGLNIANFGIKFGGWNFDSTLGAFATHDEHKTHFGLTSMFETTIKYRMEDAIAHALDAEEARTAPLGTHWRELDSGESISLLA
ncbi:hypothetical protein LTR56_003194 [Elasticomyces elasticus]|nr:hypothetical protein LTR22_010727 [Elasticomyces elasticus]KAK3656062.1 hypothetical protein LTR56_003194 [Elasticomyces elasticus]KAK4920876.1 hypothetical protein LTR49_011598 [Elasticomyces elasticus]KAK5759608.1 hypothetical protein LTS12_010301 [Elasticomyces elasticus]